MGVFANPADTGGASRKVSENGGVGVASVESKKQGTVFAAGILIEACPQWQYLLSGAQTEAGSARRETVLGDGFGRGIAFGLLRRRGMKEGNRGKSEVAVLAGHRGGHLQEALAADEVCLEARTERVATPSHPRCTKTGTTQERIVKDGAKGSARG